MARSLRGILPISRPLLSYLAHASLFELCMRTPTSQVLPRDTLGITVVCI